MSRLFVVNVLWSLRCSFFIDLEWMKKMYIELLKNVSCVKLAVSTGRRFFLKILSGFNILEIELKHDFVKGQFPVHQLMKLHGYCWNSISCVSHAVTHSISFLNVVVLFHIFFLEGWSFDKSVDILNKWNGNEGMKQRLALVTKPFVLYIHDDKGWTTEKLETQTIAIRDMWHIRKNDRK